MRTKKKVLATALAVCLVSILSFSTLAWFNATESVTNRFMVATSGGGSGGSGSTPAEKVFSVDVWEYVDKDGNGTVEESEKVSYRDDTTPGWNYDNILPGVTYHKEPVVENTGSYDQYIRVVVSLSNAYNWQNVLPAGYDLGTIFLNHDENLWERDTALTYYTADGSVNYVYYLRAALAPGGTASVFTDVKLPEWLTQSDMAKLADANGDVKFDITVRADALQTTFDASSGVTDAASAFAYVQWLPDQAKPANP